MPAGRPPVAALVVGLVLGAAAVVTGCGAAGPGSPAGAPATTGGAAGSAPAASTPPVPAGLDPARPIVLIDELPGPISLPDTWDARTAVLYADGTLVASGRGGALLEATSATLSGDALATAWARVHDAGLAQSASLALDGLYDAGTTRVVVDDGTARTELLVYALGAEPADGQSPFPAADAAVRRNAMETIAMLHGLADGPAWTPPALLLWWSRHEDAPGGAVAPRVPWTAGVDLATAGVRVDHPVFERCLRLDGDAAAAVAGLARTLRLDVVVEQAGASYALAVRPIYPDEQGVACHGR